MRIKKIMKYYENDIKEVTLPDVADFNEWGIPYRGVAWTKTNGEAFGKMLTIQFYDNKYNTAQESMSDHRDIIPVFVLNKETPTPVGHYVFVGHIPCVVIGKNRVMSCIPLREKKKICKTGDLNWAEGFKFEDTELYQYLNIDYWSLEVAREDLVDKDFVSDEEPEEETDTEMAKAMEFANAICCDGNGKERLFCTPNHEAVGIYYVDRGDGTGYYVKEIIPYWAVLEALSYEFDSEFYEHVSNTRSLDKCYDSGTDAFLDFYREWASRTDYVEYNKSNLINGAMHSCWGDNVLKNIKDWAENVEGYDASQVFSARGIY